MLRFAEELMLLLLDNENGEFIQVPNRTMQYALAGAVLMDLASEYCIDTDLEQLILLDPTPVGDDLLDPTLADIAQETNVHDIGFWVERTTERADSIREKALARLSERGILEVDEGGFVSLTLWVSRARRYPISEDKVKQEVMLRIMGVLFTDDIPEPRDVVLICLVDACKILARILSRSEYAEAEERIEQVRQMGPHRPIGLPGHSEDDLRRGAEAKKSRLQGSSPPCAGVALGRQCLQHDGGHTFISHKTVPTVGAYFFATGP